MKYKKHSSEVLLRYMHMLERGVTINFISRKYGIDIFRLMVYWKKYQSSGKESLVQKQDIRADGKLREQVVRDYEEKHIPLVKILLKYNVSVSSVWNWRKIVR